MEPGVEFKVWNGDKRETIVTWLRMFAHIKRVTKLNSRLSY